MMKITKQLRSLVSASLLLFTTVPTAEAEERISIVPHPAAICVYGDRDVIFSDRPLVYGNDSQLTDIAGTFVEDMKESGFIEFGVTREKDRSEVQLYLDTSLAEEEYVLWTDRTAGVIVYGGSAKGVWWGLKTFEQLLGQSVRDGDLRIPALRIQDKPQFPYRGALLDCCRYFFTVEEVKSFIDMISLHKINTFHWHLTDDQGWRIEILRYPLLTEKGSVRKETLVGHLYESDSYDGTPYGGYYTQDDIRDVVAYAAARQVTVIPEIEMPGHAQAALASYPWLGCTGAGYEVATKWGISPEIFCIGKDSTLQFLENVLEEVCGLFPGEYINIGGDETPHDRWKECPHCQNRMRELGLSDEGQLHTFLVNSMESFLASKGRRIIGWEEIIRGGGVSSEAVVMSWLDRGAEQDAARMGNSVIMAPHSYVYLDYYQTEDPPANGEHPGIGGFISLEKCYSFDPCQGVEEESTGRIIGVQANMWTEYISEFGYIQYMMLPRLAAIAETGWSSQKTDYPDFVDRVRAGLVPVYEARKFRYARYAF